MYPGDGQEHWSSISFDGFHTVSMGFLVRPGESYRMATFEAYSSGLTLLGWKLLPNGEGVGTFSCPAGGDPCTFFLPFVLRPGIGENTGWYWFSFERLSPQVTDYRWILFDS